MTSILKLDPLLPNAYVLLKAELICMHERSLWDHIKELFTMPLLGAQQPTELLATMETLRPTNPELWFRYQYCSRLPAETQRQLAEHQGTLKELSATVDELYQKAPITTATTDSTLRQPPRHSRPKTAGTSSPSGRGPRMLMAVAARPARSAPPPKKRPAQGEGKPWLDPGLCFYHWNWGAKAEKCEPPCYRKLGN